MKKVCGTLFFVLVAVYLIGSIVGGSLFADAGYSGPTAAAATYGAFFGRIIVIAAYVASGIFFFALDKTDGMDIVEGMKKRKGFMAPAVILAVFYFAQAMLSMFAGVSGAPYGTSFAEAMLSGFLNAAIPLVCLIIFIYACTAWIYPLVAASNAFKSMNIENFACEKFLPVNDSSQIYANPNAILIKNLLIVIPITQIAVVEEKRDLWMKNVVIKTVSGKKITIVSNEYANIQAFLDRVRAK